VLRSCHRMREVERLRESTAIDARIDRLTGVCNRATLLSMLFRETDRVQRMRTQLSVILFDLDHFGEWNSHLGFAVCDDLLCQVVGRAMRLLRSYDILGRTGNDEFLLILPGCGIADAQMLSERLRADVFGSPFLTANKSVQLTACFGIAPSLGRSPIVVLRAAEEALAQAVQEGNESIRCSGCDQRGEDATVSFLSPGSGEGTLSW
jgi:diguanylate cyclase (GGDEF)-like protein